MKFQKSLLLLIIVFFSLNILHSQVNIETNNQLDRPKFQIGAYYFDGWTGTYPYHITPSLIDSFPEREPKWGWVTSKQRIIDKQLKYAKKIGLSFFSFCWYYDSKKKGNYEPLNQALSLYKKSKSKNNIKYCLMIANHDGFQIGPSDWDFVTEDWVNQFQDKESYLEIDSKPLIIFFSFQTLINKFGSPAEVKKSFDFFKSKAINAGLKGVTIAICCSPNPTDIGLIESCGFDILTGYNYHNLGKYYFKGEKTIPIDSLTKWETKLWDRFKYVSNLKYIPASTLNWDPRPWSDGKNGYSKEIRYIGFSSNSVYNSLLGCKNWLLKNQDYTPKERVAILYAWNENGEGAWLTPGKKGFNPADGLKKAIRKRK